MVLKKPEFFGHEQDVAGPHPKAGILEAKVAEALANDGEVDAVDVQATLTGDDEVTLTGTVCRQEEIARCSEIARSIEGVRSVTNRLTVRAGRG